MFWGFDRHVWIETGRRYSLRGEQEGNAAAPSGRLKNLQSSSKTAHRCVWVKPPFQQAALLFFSRDFFSFYPLRKNWFAVCWLINSLADVARTSSTRMPSTLVGPGSDRQALVNCSGPGGGQAGLSFRLKNGRFHDQWTNGGPTSSWPFISDICLTSSVAILCFVGVYSWVERYLITQLFTKKHFKKIQITFCIKQKYLFCEFMIGNCPTVKQRQESVALSMFSFLSHQIKKGANSA